MRYYTHPRRTGRRSEGWAGPGQGLTLPVVLVVAHAGQGDHHGTVEGQDGSTEPPALAPPTLGETMQFASQVEGREAETRKGNCQRETAGVILAGGEWQGHSTRASWLPSCTPPGWDPPGWDHAGNRHHEAICVPAGATMVLNFQP